MTEGLSLIYQEAIRNKPELIQYVDEQEVGQKQYEDLCIIAIEIDATSIKHIKNPSDKIKREVLKYDPSYINQIENATEEDYILACQSNPYQNIAFYDSIPKEKLTHKVIMAILLRNPSFITRISKEDQNKEMAECVLTRRSILFSHINQNVIDDAKIVSVLKISGEQIKFVNPDRLTQEMCTVAITTDPHSAEFVPEKFQDPVVCKNIVSRIPTVIQHIVNQTEEMGLIAIRKDPNAYQHIKEPTDKHVAELIKQKRIPMGGLKSYSISIIDALASEKITGWMSAPISTYCLYFYGTCYEQFNLLFNYPNRLNNQLWHSIQSGTYKGRGQFIYNKICPAGGIKQEDIDKYNQYALTRKQIIFGIINCSDSYKYGFNWKAFPKKYIMYFLHYFPYKYNFFNISQISTFKNYLSLIHSYKRAGYNLPKKLQTHIINGTKKKYDIDHLIYIMKVMLKTGYGSYKEFAEVTGVGEYWKELVKAYLIGNKRYVGDDTMDELPEGSLEIAKDCVLNHGINPDILKGRMDEKSHKKFINKAYKQCSKVIEINPMSFAEINFELSDEQYTKLAKKAVEKNGEVIIHVESKYITDELIDIALKTYGAYIDKCKKKTIERAKVALQTYPSAIVYIPKTSQTVEQCRLTLKNNMYHWRHCNIIPEELRDKHIIYMKYRERQSTYGGPMNKRLWKVALEEGYHNQVPRTMYKDQDFARFALDYNSCAIWYISKPTIDDYIRMLKHDGMMLWIIDLQTEEMCLTAVKQNPEAIIYVDTQTEKICKCVYESNPDLMIFFESKFNYLTDLPSATIDEDDNSEDEDDE